MNNITGKLFFIGSVLYSLTTYAMDSSENLVSNTNDEGQCKFNSSNVPLRNYLNLDGVVIDSSRYRAIEGDENYNLTTILLQNNDIVLVKEHFCYMYSLDIKYIANGDQEIGKLISVLDIFDKIIINIHARHYLAEKLSQIVLDTLSMPQKVLEEIFSVNLPGRQTKGNINVDYFIQYSQEGGDFNKSLFTFHLEAGSLMH